MYSGPLALDLTTADAEASFTIFGPVPAETRLSGVGFYVGRSGGTAPAIGFFVAAGCVFFEGGAAPSANLASFLLGRPLFRGIAGANTVLQGVNIGVGNLEGATHIWIPVHTLSPMLPYFIGLWIDNGTGENVTAFGHVDFDEGPVVGSSHV